MKKLLNISFILIMLSGCSKMSDDVGKSNVEIDSNSKSIILYFSKPEMNGTDTVAGASRVVSKNDEILGNVEQLANWISADTGYPVARIETVEDYPDDHDTLVDQATAERSSDTRPKLKPLSVSLDDYDTIFIGYPIWWGDMPMAMYTFFENNDLANKTIIPFSSHGGSGLAGTVDTIESLTNDSAKVETDNVLSISRDDIPKSKQDVEKWVDSLNLKQ